MKILAINGSYRGNRGYTSYLIDKLLAGASSAGASCEVIHLSSQNIKRCTGCFTCQQEAHLLSCIYENKDDTKEIFEKIRAADLLIFATPVYVFNQSSLLSQLLERYLGICNSRAFHFTNPRHLNSGLFFHHVDRAVCSKPFITLVCQDNLETKTHRSIMSYYQIFSQFMEAPYVGHLCRRSGGVAMHGQEKALEKYPVLNEIYQAFYDAGQELALTGQLSRGVMKRANQPLIQLPPMIHTLMWIPFFRKTASDKIQQLL